MQQFSNEVNIRQFLAENRWPNGLQNALIQSIQRFPLRFMILDDSGSMMEPDGHILVPHLGQYRYIECSRWKELSTAMKFHAQVAHLSNSRTEFRFLNSANPVIIGEADSFEKLQVLNRLLDQSPGGGTPLCKHIREVIEQIKSVEGMLRSNGQKAVVVIATDGESSDGDIADAMRPLQNLPVWVVIRLCTDSEAIVEYWNNIDSQLELEMDVLDDLTGEAEEVTGNNPWLTYGEPLHRLREWGVHFKEIDLLDEDKLSRDQMSSIVNLLLNIDPNRTELPNPAIDWNNYIRIITEANNSELQVWDPLGKKMNHWIKIHQLNRQYSKSVLCSSPGCTIS